MVMQHVFVLLFLLLLRHPASVSSLVPADALNAMPGEFPGMVLIDIQKNEGSYFCGGTLIDKSHIVTAGHCVAGVYEANVPKLQFLKKILLLIIICEENFSKWR